MIGFRQGADENSPILGRFPDRWWHQWEKRLYYFTEDGAFQPIWGFSEVQRTKRRDLEARLQDLVRGVDEGSQERIGAGDAGF
jgi:hypothetical protein